MSRASRIPYHQNVYDLLQIEPGESPEAARMIVEHEFEYGLLPASVYEWYHVPNVVLLSRAEWSLEAEEETLWAELSGDAHPHTLDRVLERFGQIGEFTEPPCVAVLTEQQGGFCWYVQVNRVEDDDYDDPPMWIGPSEVYHREWEQVADRFSDFIWQGASAAYLDSYTRLSGNWLSADVGELGYDPNEPRFVKHYSNGLWLRTPAEPLQPPVIDFLTDQFDEPERTPRPGSVTTYTYRPEGGTIRVTADEPALTGGLSAWWVHADTPERLAEFAKLLLPWGTLRETPRADTDPAREVLSRVLR